MGSLKRVLRKERGATMVMVAVAIVMIFGFAVLAIDLSLLQLAKTQLQNGADASALAGAQRLCCCGQDSARAEAIRIAGLNLAVEDIQRPVIIGNSDISFPDSSHITVITHRTKATGDPVTLYFMKVLGSENKGEMKAKATATCGASCLEPFCPPDRWFDANGDGMWNPDSGDYYDPVTTGYMGPGDIGDTVILRLLNSNQAFKMAWYYPVRFPGYQGAKDYQEWICGCKDAWVMIRIGDLLQLETGAMAGPTKQGLDCLVQRDPGATWNPVTNTIDGSCCEISPRIVKAAAFDPRIGVQNCPSSGGRCVTVVKFIIIFVAGYDSKGDIVGIFLDLANEKDFLYTSRLVE
jgi:hypothetical protein